MLLFWIHCIALFAFLHAHLETFPAAVSAPPSFSHPFLKQCLLERKGQNKPANAPQHLLLKEVSAQNRRLKNMVLPALFLLGCYLKYKKIGRTWLVNYIFTAEEINSEKVLGETALVEACRKGKSLLIDYFLCHKGIDVNKKSNGQTPLAWSIVSEAIEGTKMLLADGRIDPNLKNNEGETPLMLACQKQNLSAIVMLLKHLKTAPEIEDLEQKNGLAYIVDLLIISNKISQSDIKNIYDALYKRYNLLFYGFLRQRYGIKKRQEAPLLVYIIYQTGYPLHSLMH